MTSTYSTIVNYSLKDFIKKLTRIEILNFIQNDLSMIAKRNPEDIFLFPRENKSSRNYVSKSETLNENLSSNSNIFESLTDEDIELILAKSLADAKEVAVNLGISIFDDSTNQPEYLKIPKIDLNIDSSDDEFEETLKSEKFDNLQDIPDDIC